MISWKKIFFVFGTIVAIIKMPEIAIFIAKAMTALLYVAYEHADAEPYKTMLLALSDWFHLGQRLVVGTETAASGVGQALSALMILMLGVILMKRIIKQSSKDNTKKAG